MIAIRNKDTVLAVDEAYEIYEKNPDKCKGIFRC